MLLIRTRRRNLGNCWYYAVPLFRTCEDVLLTLRNNRQEVDPGYEPPIFVDPTPGGDSTEPQNITVYLGEELNLEFVVIQRTGQQADIIVSGFACVFMEM